MEADELLTQATCVVLGPATDSTGTAADTAVGTAWLVAGTGYLLTAGHVLETLSLQGDGTHGTVWVRFPGESPVAAAVVQPPVFRKPEAIDFGLLRLCEPTSRAPLPIQLVTHLQGDVSVRGYGSNLPHAQSGAVAPAGLAYLRGERPEQYYFSYRSAQLAHTGYSGAAVYSLDARAVVGLQVESSPGSEAVFAMPLVRITEYWRELSDLARPSPRGLCVLLLPASRGEAGVRKIVDEIVRPVVEGDLLNLEVHVSTLGRTTSEDLDYLERADVVIADATDDDTNVTYELTVAQGTGTPDVVFVERGHDHSRLPFQVTEVDLTEPGEARRILQQRLLSVRAIFEAMGRAGSSNAISDFFRVPLTHVSAANALALGYYLNFVKPVATALLEAVAGIGHVIEVDGQVLDPDQMQRISLDVVIPKRLSWSSDGFILRHVGGPRLAVPAVVSCTDWSRPRPMLALPEPDPSGVIHLLDVFPTTMATMATAIDQRLGIRDPARRLDAAWEPIERKEIDRFASSLVHQITSETTTVSGYELREVCRIVDWHTVFPGLAGY